MSANDGIIIEEVDMLTETDETILPAVVRSELNFLQFPFFALSWRGLKGKIETEYCFVEERNGKKVELLWRVTANAKYGYPTPFDRKVARAIDAVIQEEIDGDGYPIANPIQFSIYHLADLMNFKSRGGTVYGQIKEALRRITFTGVESRGSFYLKDEEVWVEDVFHMYERVRFKGMKLPDGSIAETNYLWLGEEYLRNINSQHVAPLDYQYMASLSSALASRLYEVLGRKFFGLPRGQKIFRISYERLCKILPIKQQQYVSSAAQKLKTAHGELEDTEFLKCVKYERARNSEDFNVVYHLGKRAQAERDGSLTRKLHAKEQLSLPLPDESRQSEHSALAQALEDRGVSRYTAEELVREHNSGTIRDKIAMYDMLKAAGSPNISLSDGGWLRRAIEQDWTLSEKQQVVQERRASEQVAQSRKERWLEERQRRIEQELEAWDSVPPEERFGTFIEMSAWRGPLSEEKREEKLQGLIETYSTDKMKRVWIERQIPTEPPDDFE